MALAQAQPGFWNDPAHAAREFARYNQLSFRVERLERLLEQHRSLSAQLDQLREADLGRGRRLPVVDDIAKLAERVQEADLELRHFGLDGDHDEADALLRLRPEAGDHAAADALQVLRQMWQMYAAWAQAGSRHAHLLYLPAKGGIEAPMLIGAISGPLAFGYLRREAGQHRFRLRRGTEDSPGLAVVVRVQVYPVLLEGDAPLAPREVIEQSYALKLSIDEPGGPRRVRSAVLAHTADGQLLPLQNERDLSDNRALCRRLVAAVNAFPAGGQPATGDPLVRTYDLAGQPRLKDIATEHITGRLHDVLSGDLDELLRLRVRQIPVPAG
ncbi:MAG: PCRF domain-containing protein [Myxococcota bacterium]|nr:PCRF domain-containing protein [Myxococcota bacterium]